MKVTSRHEAELTVSLPVGVHAVIMPNGRLRLNALSGESTADAVARLRDVAQRIESAARDTERQAE